MTRKRRHKGEGSIDSVAKIHGGGATGGDRFSKTVKGKTEATKELRRTARDCFSPGRFSARAVDDTAHEIALNPDIFAGGTDTEIQMVHHFAGMLRRALLQDASQQGMGRQTGGGRPHASSTGERGGKRGGQKVTHGARDLLRGGFRLGCQVDPESECRCEADQQDHIHLPRLRPERWTKRISGAPAPPAT